MFSVLSDDVCHFKGCSPYCLNYKPAVDREILVAPMVERYGSSVFAATRRESGQMFLIYVWFSSFRHNSSFTHKIAFGFSATDDDCLSDKK